MHTKQVFILIAFALFGLAAASGWHARASTAAKVVSPNEALRTVYEYSVVTTTFGLEEKGNEIHYTTVWDYSATQREIIGESVNSAEASYGPILNFLGAGVAHPDLQALLQALGKNGWRLEQTEVHPNKTVRIFIRSAG